MHQTTNKYSSTPIIGGYGFLITETLSNFFSILNPVIHPDSRTNFQPFFNTLHHSLTRSTFINTSTEQNLHSQLQSHSIIPIIFIGINLTTTQFHHSNFQNNHSTGKINQRKEEVEEKSGRVRQRGKSQNSYLERGICLCSSSPSKILAW